MAVSAEDRLWETAKKLREARVGAARSQGYSEVQGAEAERRRIEELERKKKNSFLPALQGLVSGGVAGFVAGGPVGAAIGALGGGTLGAVGRQAFNSAPGSMGMLGQGAMSLAGIANARGAAANDASISGRIQRNMSLQTQLNPDLANPVAENKMVDFAQPEAMDFGGEANFEPVAEQNLMDAAQMYGDMYNEASPAKKRRGR